MQNAVFDRGALIDSAQWAQMHSTYTQAIQRVAHPPGSDHFVIRKKTLKQADQTYDTLTVQ